MFEIMVGLFYKNGQVYSNVQYVLSLILHLLSQLITLLTELMTGIDTTLFYLTAHITTSLRLFFVTAGMLTTLLICHESRSTCFSSMYYS
jgi:hypothetical protein